MLLPNTLYAFVFADSPVCESDEASVMGVAVSETVALTCRVDSNPATGLKFHWVFNHTLDDPVPEYDDEEEPLSAFSQTNGTVSVLTYAPGPRGEYGTVLCFANNIIGRQRKACVFHIIPAGN